MTGVVRNTNVDVSGNEVILTRRIDAPDYPLCQGAPSFHKHMDKMIGGQFDQCLSPMKSVVESAPKS